MPWSCPYLLNVFPQNTNLSLNLLPFRLSVFLLFRKYILLELRRESPLPRGGEGQGEGANPPR
jgi:hypothetical protein